MPRNGMTTRELVVVVVVIAAVAVAVYPFARWAREKRQKRLDDELLGAVRAGDAGEARRLLARGAHVEAKDRGGRQAGCPA